MSLLSEVLYAGMALLDQALGPSYPQLGGKHCRKNVLCNHLEKILFGFIIEVSGMGDYDQVQLREYDQILASPSP